MKPSTLRWAALAALASTPAHAHHSAAMFDATKEVVLQGVVKEFQYTNPHSWVLVDVADPAGKVTTWSFETASAGALLRAGVKKSALLAGDRVKVTAHPLKDGRPGAEIVVVTKADGTILNPRARPGPTG